LKQLISAKAIKNPSVNLGISYKCIDQTRILLVVSYFLNRIYEPAAEVIHK
jgi:hypothetical protein